MPFRTTLGYEVTTGTIVVTGNADPIFLVSGRIYVTLIFSIIVNPAGANACSWQYDPTAGTAAQVMCANGDINAGIAGDVVTITETAGARTLTTGAGMPWVSPVKYIFSAGTMSFVSAAADAASLIHHIFYIPIQAGAIVTVSP